MGYSKGVDKLLFVVDTHEVMHDPLQITIKHPLGCPNRGSGLDKGKTFHPWKLAVERLTSCGIALTGEQFNQLHTIGEQVAHAPR